MTDYQGSVPGTIVLGLDGANWDLVSPWIESGKLPNIRKIREDGVYADSESCLPPVTFPNWRCQSTGRTRGSVAHLILP